MIRVAPLAASVLLLLLSACGKRKAEVTPEPARAVTREAKAVAYEAPVRTVCPGRYGPPVVAARLEDDVVVEASGLAPSLRRPDVLWTHNDSGDGPFVYAVRTDGRRLARAKLRGVSPVDIEDLAAASCPTDRNAPCLWVGDIGDNPRLRPTVLVHVFAEPSPGGGAIELDIDAPVLRTLRLRYPDGALDAESLVVSEAGDALWILEKTRAHNPSARVFRHRLGEPTEGAVTLEHIADLPNPGAGEGGGGRITAADLHPDGRRLLVRVYGGSYEYVLPRPGALEALGSIAPSTVALGPKAEQQGEAICYGGDGRSVWTLSEDPEDEGRQPLHNYPCVE